MNLLKSPSKHVTELARALGLPVGMTKWFELRVPAHEVATLTACMYIEDSATGTLIEVLKHYQLTERSDEDDNSCNA